MQQKFLTSEFQINSKIEKPSLTKLTQKYCMLNIASSFSGAAEPLQDLGGASAQSVTFQDRMAIVILLREIGERRSLLCRLNNRLKRHSQLELI